MLFLILSMFFFTTIKIKETNKLRLFLTFVQYSICMWRNFFLSLR